MFRDALYRFYTYAKLPCAIGIAFFIFNLFLLSSFGATWDEPLHRNWGEMFLRFLSTGDEQFLDQIPGHGIYYGPLTYILNIAVSKFFLHFTSLPFFAANHIANLLWAALGISTLFAYIRMAFGRVSAWWTIGGVSAIPPLLAHAHYNPKDVPFAVVVIIVIAFFHSFLLRPSFKRALLLGLSFGLLTAIKVSSVILLPVLGITFLVVRCFQKESRVPISSDLQWILIACITSVVGVFLFWPTLWVKPGLLFEALKFFLTQDFWPGNVLYFGEKFAGADLPWHYTFFWFLASLPTIIIVAWYTGTLFAIRNIFQRENTLGWSLVVFWCFVPLLLSLKPGLVRYDGMRQFLFVLPSIAILAGMGLQLVFAYLNKKFVQYKWVVVCLSILMLGWTGREYVLIHPFEGAYMNEVVRTLLVPSIEEKLDIEYWGASYKQGLDWLNTNAEKGSIICIPIAEPLIPWYTVREDLHFSCDATTNYVMFFSRYDKEKQRPFVNLIPVLRIERYKSDLLRIYHIRG